MCRAIFARRLPFATSASNWVSRMRTSASSAATKKAFISTSTTTASSFRPSWMNCVQFISQSSSSSCSSSSSKKLCFEDQSEDEKEKCSSQFHLAEHEFQDVFQGHDAGLAAVARQHDGQPLARALHPAQCDLQPHVFLHEQCWRHVHGRGMLQVKG